MSVIGPFPKAAQYYPLPAEFTEDHGVLLHLVECPGCGLTQLSNEPVEYYRQVITAASLSPVVREQRLALFCELKKSLPTASHYRALEIGCAQGENLPLLEHAGFSAQGTECSPPGQERVDPPANILDCYLLDLDPRLNGQIDLLVSFNYLEHQPDSRAFLTRCQQLLSPEGRLLLTVPNLEFLLSSRSAHEFVTDHLVYYTPETLETALRLTGFELLDRQVINNQYDIQIIARKRRPSPIPECTEALTHLVKALNQKLQAFREAGKIVAVWGAGHRTLALLSLAEHHLIHCIIDSARFKHHRFAPISHLEILPPETLLDPACGIDVILVMVPGIYPKEVIQKIHALPVRYHAEEFPAPAEQIEK